MSSTNENIKIQNFLDGLPFQNGVFMGQCGNEFKAFEKSYIALRNSEQRFFTDEIVARLPALDNHIHSQEWALRSRSANRLTNYFKNQPGTNLLDIGCGNGWFSHLLALDGRIQVMGLDVNLDELKQAARVFNRQNLKFVYADLFTERLPFAAFHFITLNASVQYFSQLPALLSRLFELLAPGGEIHIIDSPFYSSEALDHAIERSQAYYTKAGFPAMAAHYHHHAWHALESYRYQILYSPPGSKWSKLFRTKDILFPWIKILKPDGEN